jgi:transcription factor C subunit 6
MQEHRYGAWTGAQSTLMIDLVNVFVYPSVPKLIVSSTGRSYRQYLAVAPFPSQSHSPDIGTRVKRPSHACIQIWSLGPTSERNRNDGWDTLEDNKPDVGGMICEMVICIESGPAHQIRWCPLPSHDSVSCCCSPTIW